MTLVDVNAGEKMSGFGDYISDISAYAGVPVLPKPYARAALEQALARVME